MKGKKSSRALRSPRSSPSPAAPEPEPDRRPDKPVQEVTDRQQEKSSYEITVRVPRALVARLQKAAFYALLTYAGLLTLPLALYVPGTGLDASWATALNLLPHTHYKFGTDVIFTFGPLGFIAEPQNIGGNLPVAWLIRLLVWGLLLHELAQRYRRATLSRVGCVIAVIAVVMAHQFLTGFIEYLLASAGLLLILHDSPEEQSPVNAVVMSLLTSVAFLTKQSGYVMLLISGCAYFSVWYLRKRLAPSRAALLRLAAVAVVPMLAYLVYHASLTGLWAYVTGAAQIASSYSVAMSVGRLPEYEALRRGLLTVLLVGFAASAVWKKWLGVETAACILAAFYVAMRHSVVRESDGHISIVFAFSIVLMGFLVLHCRQTKAALLTGVLVFASVAALSLVEMIPFWGTLELKNWSMVPQFNEIGTLFHWSGSMAAAAAQAEANLRSDRLSDSLRARIGQGPVIVFPTELSYAPANHLNLLPLYTLQAYVAYTHELDLRTADRLLASPSGTRLLMRWGSIDERHPLIEVPATWEAIYAWFRPEVAESDLLLLEKRDRPSVHHSQPLGSALVDLRQWQEVPDRDHAVRVGVAFSQTALGAARKLLYKVDPVYIELEPDVGRPQRFRVIPDVLQQPFLINCLPLSSAALEDLLFESNCPQRVRRFRFLGQGLSSFSGAARVTFTEAPDERFHFAARENTGSRVSKIPLAVEEFWYGVVDAVDGGPCLAKIPPHTLSGFSPAKGWKSPGGPAQIGLGARRSMRCTRPWESGNSRGLQR